jgi:hypothetical protein
VTYRVVVTARANADAIQASRWAPGHPSLIRGAPVERSRGEFLFGGIKIKRGRGGTPGRRRSPEHKLMMI